MDSPPAVQGNTSGNVMRPAILETGAEVMILYLLNKAPRFAWIRVMVLI